MVALLPRVKSRLFIHANRRSTNLLEGEYAAISRNVSRVLSLIRTMAWPITHLLSTIQYTE